MSSVEGPWSLVLAGGEGKRLQSLTTDPHGVSTPKQYWSLDGHVSLLGLAFRRARRVTPRNRVATVVAQEHRRWWATEVADLMPENVVVQPRNRGTAAGVLLPLLNVLTHDPEATILFLPSDHFIADEPLLERAVRQALVEITRDPDRLVLLGMEPDEMDAEFGWIVPVECTGGASRVDCFVEKPSATIAEGLMRRGGLWNSFIFVARGQAVLNLYEQRLPGLLATLRGALETQRLAEIYDELGTNDFCRDLLQGSEDVLQAIAVPPCGWSDLGTVDRVARCVEQHPVPQARDHALGNRLVARAV